jgi:hypothetical protein
MARGEAELLELVDAVVIGREAARPTRAYAGLHPPPVAGKRQL